MDAVLGLSVTSSAVGLVLVEGQDADSAAMDGAGFEVATSQQAADAVRRTEAIAAQRGRRVQSIGVTWSDDAHTEASLLLKSLSDSGFDNIVPVRLSEATDALARGIAEVMGYHTTAVCVVEPGQLIALVVTPDDGAVQTAVNSTVVTEDDLIGWLSAVFTRADWEPEALVLVGSVEDLDGLVPVLEDALAVPVFSPAEAQLALARGAALACAPAGEAFWADEREPAPPSSRRRNERFLKAAPVVMLATGAVAFVASVSAALGLQFVPDRPAPPVRPAAETVVPAPRSTPAPPPPPPVAEVPAPPPVVEEAPVVEEPAPDTAPVQEAPAPDPAPVEGADVPPPPDAAAPPVLPAPEVVPPPVPEERPGILQRIRDRLAGVGQNEPPPAVAPPPVPPVLP
ncbi:hypothetical protein EV589_3944 [Mycobacterium sp. BK558]|uniref:DUF7159 domain-containing protein n=1 Tax=Mycolicibacterium chlorophenolicum TaxID=37916 RepID=A0A0J6YS63_9MYCO|nr:hypothetical protein [Mycolicibacterium chlorophenolicum]KMO75406.1 hypothetical protein MCHLDSM_03626 [Mycolicibacterium chlorophenolicum]RZT15790.1 hypothetical protein EV589_3944 [Mycobacterium sp. BK558]